MADSNSISKLPSPYVNRVSENDPIVIRVDQDRGEIGSRASGLPGNVRSEKMNLEHVGKNAG